MNTKNSKTFKSFRLLLNFTDTIDVESSDKYIALSKLSI